MYRRAVVCRKSTQGGVRTHPRPSVRRSFATSSGRPIKIVVINGSVRPGNYTSMASAIVADELKKDSRIAVSVVNPAELKLAMPGLAPTEDGKRLQEQVKDSAAVVLATPEYHGSFSSGNSSRDILSFHLFSLSSD